MFVNLTVFVSFCMFVESSVEASVSLSYVGFRVSLCPSKLLCCKEGSKVLAFCDFRSEVSYKVCSTFAYV